MKIDLLESLSSARFPIARIGSHRVSPTIEQEGVAVTVACGSNLGNAQIVTFEKSTSEAKSFTVREKRDGNRNPIPQFIWIFTWLKPVKEGNVITFGKGIGENDKDIARVTLTLEDQPDSANAETVPSIGPIPNRGLIPAGYQSSILHPEQPSKSVKVNVVHDLSPEHGTIQEHANVLLVDTLGGMADIKAFWNGKDNHKNAISITKEDAEPLSFCALIKSNPIRSAANGGAFFKFEVGDPRLEATVTVEEEA